MPRTNEVKASFEAGIRTQLELLGGLLQATDGEESTDKAMAILSTMIGALILSRTVNDELAERILHAAARSVQSASASEA